MRTLIVLQLFICVSVSVTICILLEISGNRKHSRRVAERKVRERLREYTRKNRTDMDI